MRINWHHLILALAFIALLADVSWAQPNPGYNTKIPKSIMTPNDIETRAGTLKWEVWQRCMGRHVDAD